MRAPIPALLEELLVGLKTALGDALEGVYLYGSLAAGDFRPEVSDIDLLIATAADVDDPQLDRLRQMHDAFARAHSDWGDRIDASYISVAALKRCKERQSAIVVISPGEPLHRTRTTPGWLMNWHEVRERGVALLGPSPRRLIAPTTSEDFVAAVRIHMEEMPGRTAASRSPAFRTYAVLTACRALYACREGRQPSKTQAALWALQLHPDWSDVIRAALDRRRGEGSPGGSRPDAGDPRVVEFVRFAADEVARH